MFSMMGIGPMELMIMIVLALVIFVGPAIVLIVVLLSLRRRGGLPPLVRCPHCGRNMLAEYAYCPNCGQAMPR